MRSYSDVLDHARAFAAAILPEPHLLAPLTPAAYVAYVEAEAAAINQTLGALDTDDLEVAGGLDAWRALVVRCVADLAPQTPALRAGDAVEVLQVWAHDTEPKWFGGYAYVRTEPSGCIITKHVGGHLDGCESRWRADQVRQQPEPLPESSDEAAARADHAHDQAKDDRLTGDR